MYTEEIVEEKQQVTGVTYSRPTYSLQGKKENKFLINNLKISNINTPLEFKNYRIVQLSDLHFGIATPKEHLIEAVNITNQLNPDLILLTGDYLQLTRTGFTHEILSKFSNNIILKHSFKLQDKAKELASILDKLKAKEGIFGVFGNHDYMEGIDIIKDEMPKHITWITNSYVDIKKNNSLLHIAGIDDLKRGKPDFAKTLIAHDKEKPFYKMLLSHNPDITIMPYRSKLSHFDLILSGHTHGGQFRIPFLPPAVTRTKQKEHVSGLSHLSNTAIYVTNGVGYGCLNLRICCPPEITLINF